MYIIISYEIFCVYIHLPCLYYNIIIIIIILLLDVIDTIETIPLHVYNMYSMMQKIEYNIYTYLNNMYQLQKI